MARVVVGRAVSRRGEGRRNSTAGESHDQHLARVTRTDGHHVCKRGMGKLLLLSEKEQTLFLGCWDTLDWFVLSKSL